MDSTKVVIEPDIDTDTEQIPLLILLFVRVSFAGPLHGPVRSGARRLLQVYGGRHSDAHARQLLAQQEHPHVDSSRNRW